MSLRESAFKSLVSEVTFNCAQEEIYETRWISIQGPPGSA
jgi:hypothetical protein